jgi:hypothetical protein
MLTYPSLSSLTFGEQQIYDALVQEEQERLERYKLAWEAYKGELPNALKVKAGQPDDNVKASKCRVIVDAGVSFLFGEDVGFSLDAEKERNPAEQWLDACWAANRKMTLLGKLGTNGAVCGHAFIKIVLDYEATAPYPRLIVLDPANVIVRWDDDDIEQVRRYIIQWKGIDASSGKPVSKRQVMSRQDNGSWLVVDYVRPEGQQGGRWTEIDSVVWPYTWPPMIDCQNIPVPNEFWGEPDIPVDIINLNKSRNFTLSNWSRIIKLQAHQRLWGKGFRADQVKMGPEDIFIIEAEQGLLSSIDPTDSQAGLDVFDRRLDEAIHEASRTPAIATGKLESTGPLSGVALQILYGPLVQKTTMKRRTYGDMLVELNRRLLELGGYGPKNVVSITWAEIVPQDMLTERQALTQDAALGIVSRDTLAQKLGYDWAVEEQKLNAESGDGDAEKSNLPTEDEGNRLKVVFDAIKSAVDAGIPLEVLLEKYLGWTPAEIAEVTAEQEAEAEADALEARERMDAMREGGMIGQQQPGQAEETPRPVRSTPNGGGTSGNRGDR